MDGHRYLIGLCTLIGLAGGQSAFADALTERVLSVLRNTAAEMAVTVMNENELQLHAATGPFTLYLDNIRAVCKAQPANCDTELDRFLGSIVSLARVGDEDKRITPEKLFPVLRGAEYSRRAAQKSTSDERRQLVVRPFVEGIEVLYVLDAPKTLRFINRGDLYTAGLSAERLHEIALRNSANLPPLKYGPAPNEPDVYFMPAGDGLGTARLFDVALWNRIEKEMGGPVVVCAPTRDWLLFAKQSNRAALDKLRRLADRVVQGEPYPLSSALFHRTNGVWRTYSR